MYTPDMVVKFFPLVWHDTFLLGEGDALPPDPDMPSAPTVDPHRAEKMHAARADMQRVYAMLSDEGKRIAVARFGLGLTFVEIEDATGVPHNTAHRREQSIIEFAVEFLNGGSFDEDDVYAS